MTSATDVLRRLLDERGVHWWAGEDERKTLWESNGLTWEYFNDENGDAWLGFLGACEQDIAPERAIAATLGATDAKPTQAESSGTCHDVWDVELTGRLRFQCSECGAVSLEITPRFCPACGRKVVEPTKNDVDVEVDA